jgi:hypothetical protein
VVLRRMKWIEQISQRRGDQVDRGGRLGRGTVSGSLGGASPLPVVDQVPVPGRRLRPTGGNAPALAAKSTPPRAVADDRSKLAPASARQDLNAAAFYYRN